MPNCKTTDQIQIRIDKKTKQEAKKILDSLGLDMSVAVKMLFKQIIYTKNIPYEIRDTNGFTLRQAQNLREAIKEAESSPKIFRSSKEVIKDALS